MGVTPKLLVRAMATLNVKRLLPSAVASQEPEPVVGAAGIGLGENQNPRSRPRRQGQTAGGQRDDRIQLLLLDNRAGTSSLLRLAGTNSTPSGTMTAAGRASWAGAGTGREQFRLLCRPTMSGRVFGGVS